MYITANFREDGTYTEGTILNDEAIDSAIAYHEIISPDTYLFINGRYITGGTSDMVTNNERIKGFKEVAEKLYKKKRREL